MAEDFISGALAGQQYKQNQEALREQPQLFELSMAEGKAKLASSQMDLQERQTALDNAKAIQQIQAKAMRSVTMGQADPNSDPTQKTTDALEAMGMADIEGGFPVQGAELLKQSAVIAKDHATIMKEQTDAQEKKLNFVAGGLQDVHDQASWDQFNMLATAEFKGTMDPRIAKQPYSPQLIKMLRDTTQTQLQKAETDRNKAQTRLDDVEARQHEAEIPLERARTAAEEALAAQRRKNAGESGQPSKEDLEAAYDLVRPSSKSGGKGATAADNAAAKAAALPIAERTAQLVKQGLSRSAAAARAYQEEKQKPASKLNDLDKADAPIETATRQIDDLLELLDKAKTRGTSVTGVPGTIRRVGEYAGNVTGLRPNDNLSSQVESRLALLQNELPTLLGTSKQLSKQRQSEVETIIRGRGRFDSIESTQQSLEDIRTVLGGGKAPERKSETFNYGERYVDANGNAAIYLGNGKWQKTK